uniref:Uncharacterized protein n=1 Tax=Anguilla anguilla TaxID=7936 RepID=A0A0E9XGG1_ANGAN
MIEKRNRKCLFNRLTHLFVVSRKRKIQMDAQTIGRHSFNMLLFKRFTQANKITLIQNSNK